DSVVGVGQQWEIQTELVLELLVRANRVGADTQDLGAMLLEHAAQVAESARLGRAAGSVVLGVEVQDDRLLAFEVGQADGAAFRRVEAGFGSRLADLWNPGLSARHAG